METNLLINLMTPSFKSNLISAQRHKICKPSSCHLTGVVQTKILFPFHFNTNISANIKFQTQNLQQNSRA